MTETVEPAGGDPDPGPRLGWRVERRPRPGFAHVLGAAAGAFLIAPDSAAGVGGIAFGFALVLGSLAYWLAPVLGEPDDGVEPVPAPTVAA